MARVFWIIGGLSVYELDYLRYYELTYSLVILELLFYHYDGVSVTITVCFYDSFLVSRWPPSLGYARTV